MARLSDMLNREVSLRFNFDGEAFELRYAPFNQTVVDDLLTSDETRDQARFNVRLLAKVLRGWDITDDSGHALPLTEESIAQLPMWCQNLLVSKIMEDQQVGKRNGASFGATLRREVSTTTSPSPNGSASLKAAGTWGSTP